MKNKVIKLLAVVSSMAITACATSTPSSSLSSTSSKEVPDSSSVSEETSSSSTSSESKPTSSSSTKTYPTIDELDGTPKSKEYVEKGYKPLFKDLNHKQGYIVTKGSYGPGESPYHDERLDLYPQDTKQPEWTIAQWGTRFDLIGSGFYDGHSHTTDESGLVHTIKSMGSGYTPAKKLIINSENGEVYLESNCRVEYLQDRTGSEPWVHLLLSQDFSNDLTFVNTLSSLYMDASYTVNFCEDKTYGTVNPNAHAAQLVYFVTVQNRNMASKDYGKYIWFGMPLWDNRDAGKFANRGYVAHDAGTDTLIYSPAGTYYFHETGGYVPELNQKARARMDILPIIKNAFNEAKNKGYLGTTKWEELALGGMNFGFEVPGTYNIGATIHDIGVYAKKA